jgi:hypothetical protein
MRRGLEGMYGRFVTAAATTTGLALTAFVSGHLIVAHARAQQAELAPPALRSLVEDRPVPVLGASIGVAPAGTGQHSLAALRAQVRDLPWEKALIRRSNGERIAQDSIFIPADTMAEAFSLCARLDRVPAGCAPAVASADQLREANGTPIGETGLARRGIAPYRPVTGRWTHVVSTAPAHLTIA